MANHPEPNQHPEQPDHDFDPFAAPHHAEEGEAMDSAIVDWASLVEDVPEDAVEPAAPGDTPSKRDWAAAASSLPGYEPSAPRRPPTDPALDFSHLEDPEALELADAVENRTDTDSSLDLSKLFSDEDRHAIGDAPAHRAESLSGPESAVDLSADFHAHPADSGPDSALDLTADFAQSEPFHSVHAASGSGPESAVDLTADFAHDAHFHATPAESGPESALDLSADFVQAENSLAAPVSEELTDTDSALDLSQLFADEGPPSQVSSTSGLDLTSEFREAEKAHAPPVEASQPQAEEEMDFTHLFADAATAEAQALPETADSGIDFAAEIVEAEEIPEAVTATDSAMDFSHLFADSPSLGQPDGSSTHLAAEIHEAQAIDEAPLATSMTETDSGMDFSHLFADATPAAEEALEVVPEEEILEAAEVVEEEPLPVAVVAHTPTETESGIDFAHLFAEEQAAASPSSASGIDVIEEYIEPEELTADTPVHAVESAPAAPVELVPDAPHFVDESSHEHETLDADREVVRQAFNLDALDSSKQLTPPSGASDLIPPSMKMTPEDDEFVDIGLAGSEGSSGSYSSSGVNLNKLDSGSFVNIVEELAAEGHSSTGAASSVNLGSRESFLVPHVLSPSSLEQDGTDSAVSGRDLIAEAVESGVDLRQPLMEIVEEDSFRAEEALDANEVIESKLDLRQPLMEIVEEDSFTAEEALEAGEIVESGVNLHQPLREMDDEPTVADAGAAPGSEHLLDLDSAVNLGAAIETHTLNRREMESLLAGQEMGAAAEVSLVSTEEVSEAPPKTSDEDQDDVVEIETAHLIAEDEGLDADDFLIQQAATAEPQGTHADFMTHHEIVEEMPVDADEFLSRLEAVESAEVPVHQEFAAPDSGIVIDELLEEPVDAGDMVSELPLEAVVEEEVSEIAEEELPHSMEAVDSSVNLEELMASSSDSGAGNIDIDALLHDAHSKPSADSGILLDNLNAKEAAESDSSEEVQLGEPAALDEEIEEAPAAVDEEEIAEKPAKPPKKRSTAGAWVGGTFLGTLIGTGACVGLFFSGVLPTTGTPSTNRPVTNVVQPPAVVPFEAKLAEVRQGNFEQAEKGGIDKIDEAKPEQLAARGEFRWLKYLNGQSKANQPIKKDDEPVKLALDDLTKASQNAENKPAAASALFHLAQIHELANDLPAAKKAYQDGAEKYKDDAKLKRMFDAALDRLSLRGDVPAGVGSLFDPHTPLEQRAFALAMLICLQPPPAPADNNDDDEAGFAFWAAVRKAKEQQYLEALESLKAARALHEKRRFVQLRKSQNPLSDPTEEIFLRACDELKTYWTIQEKLQTSKYLTKDKKPAEALDDALKAAADGSTALKALSDKLLADKIIDKPEDFAAGVDKLLADKKEADKRTAALVDVLVKEKVLDKAPEAPEMFDKAAADGVDKLLVERKTAADKIVDLNKMLKDADTALADLKKESAALAAELKTEKEGLKGVAAQLAAAKFIDDKADGPRVLLGLKEAIDLAQMKDPQGALRQLRTEVAAAKSALSERWEPRDMLAIWLPVLANRTSKDLADKALRDANRVFNDPKAPLEDKAKAQALIGLTLRNDEKYAEAKDALEAAKKNLGDNAWVTVVDAALRDAANPTAALLANVNTLRGQGDYEGAVAALTKTLDLLPADKRNELLAERSLLRLDAVKAKQRGPLMANDLAAASQDANAAAAAGVTQGFYAAGRIAEELGQWADAIAAYRKAVAATPELDEKSSRYRIALARVLVQSQRRVGLLEAQPKEERVAQLPALKTLALLLTVSLQAPLLPPAQEEEALKLADEILAARPETIPFEVRAQAFAIKGLHTQALKTYAEGLRMKKPLSPDHADVLEKLIDAHPLLKRPESLRIANPLSAEKHYGAGLRWYFDHDFNNAEKELLEAIKNDSLDARYHYFLGLAHLAQGKQEAYEDFAQGARLEAQERPSRAAVSAALERVQGPMRRTLNEARNQSR